MVGEVCGAARREREDAAEALRQARTELALRPLGREPDLGFPSRVEAPLQDLLAVVTRRVSAMQDPEVVQWAVEALASLKVRARCCACTASDWCMWV